MLVPLEAKFTMICPCGRVVVHVLEGFELDNGQSCWVGCKTCRVILGEFYNHEGAIGLYSHGDINPFTRRRVGE